MESYVAFAVVAGITLIALVLLAAWGGREIPTADVERLAVKRRRRAVEQHFAAGPPDLEAHPAFKGSLSPQGRLYPADIPLDQVPSFAGSLLKYKKHEWMVFCLATGTRCVALWVNKGPDKTSVLSGLTAEEIAMACAQLGCNSVLAFHNHPASNPGNYSYRMPSDADVAIAARQAEILNAKGISFLAFVCERGWPHRYACCPADDVFPLSEVQRQVEGECNRNWWSNVRLRLELLA